LRRLVVLSILLTLVGLLLVLPSSALYSLLTSSGSTTSLSFELSRESSATSNTTTIESLLGFGLIGVGVILEILSLFTEIGGAPVGTEALGRTAVSSQPAEKKELQGP
jgi:hypothetical protein